MTFYVAPGSLTVPGGDWLSKMAAARTELDKIPEVQRFGELNIESRSSALHDLLEAPEGVALFDMEGGVIEEIRLAVMHVDEQARLVLLAVLVDEGAPGGPHTVAFDRLFEGQYDPEELQLTDQDTPYVVVKLDEQGQPAGPATVIQPHAEDTPDGVCAAVTLSPDFIAHLLQLAA